MNENILRYARENNITVREEASSFDLQVDTAHYSYEVTLVSGQHTLEWFLTVKERASGETAFSDYIDHYETEGETYDQLVREREASVISLLKAIRTHPARISINSVLSIGRFSIGKFKVLELKSDVGWVHYGELI